MRIVRRKGETGGGASMGGARMPGAKSLSSKGTLSLNFFSQVPKTAGPILNRFGFVGVEATLFLEKGINLSISNSLTI